MSGNVPYPPLPFCPFPELTIYEIDATNHVYIFDDTLVDYPALDAQIAADLAEQRLMSLLEGQMEENDSGGSFEALSFSSSDLWLEIVSVTNAAAGQTAFLVIHPPENETNVVYDLFATTNLSRTVPGLNATNWQWVLRCDPGQTNLVVTNLTVEQCYFLLARTNDEDGDGLSHAFERLVSHSDPANADTDGDGMPDGWEWNNFGSFDPTAGGDYDGDFINNGLEYTNHTEPNDIQFTLLATNRYVRDVSVPVQLNITAGVPSSMAVLVNDTNFASAAWQPFNTNSLATLGATNGDYQIWVGLRGRLESSQQTWAATLVTLDTVAPTLTITNPAASIVSRALVQLQGYASESLAGLSFGVSNAARILTGEPGYVIGQSYDTNTLKLTRDYFQCYDIFLTNGVNVITLQAADLAGNTFTTNVSLTLDTSNDTNPPAFTLTWPVPGTTIAGSQFTLQGLVTDPTATVRATVVDTGGSTNVASGLVNRDGKVWVYNLPLGSVTNRVTVTATGVGGSSSTNFDIVRSDAGLTLDPLTSDQLNQPFVDVSGSVSNPNYGVEVNGVIATVENDGHWVAYYVAVKPSDTAVLDVEVYDTATNSIGVQRFSQAQPTTVGLMSYSGDYSSTWHRAGYWAVPPGGVGDLIPAYGHAADSVHWNYQTGGSENGHDFFTGYVVPNNQPGRDLQWADELEAGADHFAPNPSTPSIFGVGEWKNTAWSLSWGSGSVSDRTQSRVMLEPCEQAAPGEKRLYLIRARAEEYSNLQAGEASPPESLKIGGVPLMASPFGDGWGETLADVPAGALADITPLGGSGNNRSSIQQPVEEVKLAITVNGITLDSNVVVSNANFVVGQMLTFSTNWNLMLSGIKSRRVEWTFDGTFVNDSNQPCADCSLNYTNNPAKRTNETTAAWWVSGGTNGPAIYTARLTETLTQSNGSIVVASGKGLFSMLRPLPKFYAQLREEVRVDTNYWVNGTNTGKTNLHFGINYTRADVGIAFVYTNAPLIGFTTNTYGEHFITQVVDYVRQRYNRTITNDCRGYETNDMHGLDGANPYQGTKSARDNDEWPDGPGALLSTARWLSHTNSFSTYLMFQPPYTNSVAVPMYKVQWSWSGSATNNPWGKKSGSATSGQSSPTEEFPTWTHTRVPMNTSPANMFETNCFDEN